MTASSAGLVAALRQATYTDQVRRRTGWAIGGRLVDGWNRRHPGRQVRRRYGWTGVQHGVSRPRVTPPKSTARRPARTHLRRKAAAPVAPQQNTRTGTRSAGSIVTFQDYVNVVREVAQLADDVAARGGELVVAALAIDVDTDRLTAFAMATKAAAAALEDHAADLVAAYNERLKGLPQVAVHTEAV